MGKEILAKEVIEQERNEALKNEHLIEEEKKKLVEELEKVKADLKSLEQENLKADQNKEIEIKRLEIILKNNKEFMERQAQQIVSLKSKCITSQILNKKVELAKVQQKNTPIKEEERK